MSHWELRGTLVENEVDFGGAVGGNRDTFAAIVRYDSRIAFL